MEKVLRKRAWRDLKENKFRYFALAFLIIISMYLVISLVGAADTIVDGTTKQAKKHKLEDKYDMKMTTELEGRINGMCNLSDVVEERGIEQGMERGIKQGMERGIERGITGLVEVLREMGTPSELIIEKIMKKFSLTEKKAREFLK